jgi:hypothetical protein
MQKGMTRRRFASIVPVAAVLALAACTVSPKLGPDAPVAIEISQFSILVENHTGGPLTDLKVHIVPVGGATLYTSTLYRLENLERREVGFNEFRGRDGTPFDRRVVRPKAVRVAATDVQGKAITAETAWR